jgi:hypothetical protein
MSTTEKAYKKVTDDKPRQPVPAKESEALPEEQLKDVAGGLNTIEPIPSDGYATCC